MPHTVKTVDVREWARNPSLSLAAASSHQPPSQEFPVRQRIRTTLLAVVTLFPLGCGGDGDPGAPEAPSLDGTRFSLSSATSLGKVYLLGLPNPKAPEDYEVLVSTDGAEGLPLLVEGDEGGPYFRAPLHPATPNSGGGVIIQVTDGTRRSP
jgi:hypothetical protein